MTPILPRVTCTHRNRKHVQLSTFHGKLICWLNLLYLLLSNDIATGWGGREEKKKYYFHQKSMKPVQWYIFIFTVKYFPFIFSISGSRIVIMVSFIFLLPVHRNCKEISFCPDLKQLVAGKYFYKKKNIIIWNTSEVKSDEKKKHKKQIGLREDEYPQEFLSVGWNNFWRSSVLYLMILL